VNTKLYKHKSRPERTPNAFIIHVDLNEVSKGKTQQWGSKTNHRRREVHLQPGAVNDLVIDSHLHTVVVDDEDADGATAVVEGLSETGSKTALVKDGKALLDVTSLGHGNNTAVFADVKNAVLLEDGAKHVLDNDRRSGVGDEGGLLVQLLGEEVNTEVAVLASLRRGGDADDLARAALEDQEIANADVVARDGDGVGGSHLACGRGSGGNVRCRNVRGG
jgi:hypothetical protein